MLTINPNDKEKKIKQKMTMSIQMYEDTVKNLLLKDVVEYIGEFNIDLFFILELEFVPVIDLSTKKYKLTHFSNFSTEETLVDEEVSYVEFKKLLDNYIIAGKKESSDFIEKVVDVIDKLKKEGFLKFC